MVRSSFSWIDCGINSVRDVICGAVDDRTPEEMRNGPKKSRYDSIDLFVSSRKEMIPERYNDVEALLDEESYRTLIASGVDERLARHVAHLFIRDPLVIYEESMNVPDEQSTEHFENIQSTNWNTVRLKPPSLV
jgi:glutamate--cysteine ligase catalytic subunit